MPHSIVKTLPKKKKYLAQLGAGAQGIPTTGFCPICLDAFKQPARTECGHVFCLECLRLAAQNSHACAVCYKAMYKKPENMRYRFSTPSRYLNDAGDPEPGIHREMYRKRIRRLKLFFQWRDHYSEEEVVLLCYDWDWNWFEDTQSPTSSQAIQTELLHIDVLRLLPHLIAAVMHIKPNENDWPEVSLEGLQQKEWTALAYSLHEKLKNLHGHNISLRELQRELMLSARAVLYKGGRDCPVYCEKYLGAYTFEEDVDRLVKRLVFDATKMHLNEQDFLTEVEKNYHETYEPTEGSDSDDEDEDESDDDSESSDGENQDQESGGKRTVEK